MTLEIVPSKVNSGQHIKITGSKSESNRLLILQALYPEINIKNVSDSDDSKVMKAALSSSKQEIDIHHAGTAMRFLTSYFAVAEGKEHLLTGSDRMKERPIEILVTALRDLGADIEYLAKEGCPPLKIRGKTLNKSTVALDANVSSQYISSLMLIAPKLENGLEIFLKGNITSVPYINMTLELLREIGVSCSFQNNTIKINPLDKIKTLKEIIVESDWSSASYYYSIIALSEPGTSVTLSSFKFNSLQGDAKLAEIYKEFGVETRFEKHSITLKKLLVHDSNKFIDLNLLNMPDTAQTIAVTCFGLGLECKLTGLHTLKIKETDRLMALKTEIEKLNGKINITKDSLSLQPSQTINEGVEIETYNDHRMAMAFAPLGLKVPIKIKDFAVVSKSYPRFWEDLKSIGFIIKQ